MIEASLLMDNAKHFRHRFGGTLITTVLAVAVVAGGDFSAFFIFIPQFLSAAWFTFGVAVLMCCGSRQARQHNEAERLPEEEGFNAGMACMARRELQTLFDSKMPLFPKNATLVLSSRAFRLASSVCDK